MAIKKHYDVDNINKIINAEIISLTEKEKKEINNYLYFGYVLKNVEKEKKHKLTQEEKDKNPFSEKRIQEFLEQKATKEQQKKYWEIYNEQATSNKTGELLVYKKDTKDKKHKAGEPRVKGHIATLQWFKKEFPNYKDEI